jgi:hypothetical protein
MANQLPRMTLRSDNGAPPPPPPQYKKPSYDDVCTMLRDHREEMRIVYYFIDEQSLGQEMEDRIIEETGTTGFALAHYPDLDPAGGFAPETAEAMQTQLRFELAVRSLASEKKKTSEPRRVAMGVGKGRGDGQRARPY